MICCFICHNAYWIIPLLLSIAGLLILFIISVLIYGLIEKIQDNNGKKKKENTKLGNFGNDNLKCTKINGCNDDCGDKFIKAFGNRSNYTGEQNQRIIKQLKSYQCINCNLATTLRDSAKLGKVKYSPYRN